jgi:uncharacterized protein (TIGR03435 family)
MRALLLLAASAALFGQAAFEVASVKPSGPQEHELNGFYTYPGGRVVGKGMWLSYLMQIAFNVQRFQIVGAPTWIDVDRFNVEARPPASSKSSSANPPNKKSPPNDEQREMLQTLLMERFHMKFRRETSEGPVYLLTRTNKKLKLEEAKDKDAPSFVGGPVNGMIVGNGIGGQNISMPELAKRLSRYMERPIFDRTGLTGSYDFKVEYAAGEPRPDVASSILVSIQELGLKLDSARGPVEKVVIERVEKLSAN